MRNFGSAPLKFHDESGIATRLSRISFVFATSKFSLTLRSLTQLQAPTPGAMLQNWVETPVDGLIATVKPTPPVALTPNQFGTPLPKSKFCVSAQTNCPVAFACARYPAAKLKSPCARLEYPPGTVECCPGT